jgi:hypothetical protein
MKFGTSDGLKLLLRIEGVFELAIALALFAHVSGAWGTFALWFLAPDVALAGYLAGPAVGARCYNATHAFVGPALTALAGLTVLPAALPFALIWAAHIGFDRALGYGLKSVEGFRHTHLGTVGHGAR